MIYSNSSEIKYQFTPLSKIHIDTHNTHTYTPIYIHARTHTHAHINTRTHQYRVAEIKRTSILSIMGGKSPWYQ